MSKSDKPGLLPVFRELLDQWLNRDKDTLSDTEERFPTSPPADDRDKPATLVGQVVSTVLNVVDDIVPGAASLLEKVTGGSEASREKPVVHRQFEVAELPRTPGLGNAVTRPEEDAELAEILGGAKAAREARQALTGNILHVKVPTPPLDPKAKDFAPDPNATDDGLMDILGQIAAQETRLKTTERYHFKDPHHQAIAERAERLYGGDLGIVTQSAILSLLERGIHETLQDPARETEMQEYTEVFLFMKKQEQQPDHGPQRKIVPLGSGASSREPPLPFDHQYADLQNFREKHFGHPLFPDTKEALRDAFKDFNYVVPTEVADDGMATKGREPESFKSLSAILALQEELLHRGKPAAHVAAILDDIITGELLNYDAFITNVSNTGELLDMETTYTHYAQYQEKFEAWLESRGKSTAASVPAGPGGMRKAGKPPRSGGTLPGMGG